MSGPTRVDALVIGAGIAGLQTALDLADQGFAVAVVEQNPSIGGAMIGLSKVFPTLDCASCITTPKMAAAAHHPNIALHTYTEVASIRRDGDSFAVALNKKPRYVNEAECIGCRQCEYACPVEVRDEFDGSMGARRAAYIPFTNAIPQTAVIDPDDCILCGRCVTVCPTDAVVLDQKPEKFELASAGRRRRHRVAAHSPRRQGRVPRRRDHQRAGADADGAPARPARAVWPRAAAIGRQGARVGGLRPMRRLA